ncbi:MAG TPA: WYL domain-containing protein, partial [Fimbriimonas sp.]|nr:WYL domain-containing protein [Fimbriimonas sp.]
TLRPLELTGSEAFLLTLALDALQRLADVPFAQSRDTLAAKVAGLLPSTQLQRAFGRVGRVHLQVPTRPQRALNLSRLIEHCDQWAEVTYSVEEGEATYLARVQKVYADAGLWYVDAVIDGKRRNLRADRVLKIQGAQAPEQPIEPKEYDDPSHPTVRVILTGRGLRALERDPHLGGEVKDRKAPALIEFRCPPDELDWYARYFGGMGPDAEILGPPDLLEIVVGKAKALLQKYEKT